jgi:hypothetical protein
MTSQKNFRENLVKTLQRARLFGSQMIGTLIKELYFYIHLLVITILDNKDELVNNNQASFITVGINQIYHPIAVCGQ